MNCQMLFFSCDFSFGSVQMDRPNHNTERQKAAKIIKQLDHKGNKVTLLSRRKCWTLFLLGPASTYRAISYRSSGCHKASGSEDEAMPRVPF